MDADTDKNAAQQLKTLVTGISQAWTHKKTPKAADAALKKLLQTEDMEKLEYHDVNTKLIDFVWPGDLSPAEVIDILITEKYIAQAFVVWILKFNPNPLKDFPNFSELLNAAGFPKAAEYYNEQTIKPEVKPGQYGTTYKDLKHGLPIRDRNDFIYQYFEDVKEFLTYLDDIYKKSFDQPLFNRLLVIFDADGDPQLVVDDKFNFLTGTNRKIDDVNYLDSIGADMDQFVNVALTPFLQEQTKRHLHIIDRSLAGDYSQPTPKLFRMNSLNTKEDASRKLHCINHLYGTDFDNWFRSLSQEIHLIYWYVYSLVDYAAGERIDEFYFDSMLEWLNFATYFFTYLKTYELTPEEKEKIKQKAIETNDALALLWLASYSGITEEDIENPTIREILLSHSDGIAFIISRATEKLPSLEDTIYSHWEPAYEYYKKFGSGPDERLESILIQPESNTISSESDHTSRRGAAIIDYLGMNLDLPLDRKNKLIQSIPTLDKSQRYIMSVLSKFGFSGKRISWLEERIIKNLQSDNDIADIKQYLNEFAKDLIPELINAIPEQLRAKVIEPFYNDLVTTALRTNTRLTPDKEATIFEHAALEKVVGYKNKFLGDGRSVELENRFRKDLPNEAELTWESSTVLSYLANYLMLGNDEGVDDLIEILKDKAPDQYRKYLKAKQAAGEVIPVPKEPTSTWRMYLPKDIQDGFITQDQFKSLLLNSGTPKDKIDFIISKLVKLGYEHVQDVDGKQKKGFVGSEIKEFAKHKEEMRTAFDPEGYGSIQFLRQNLGLLPGGNIPLISLGISDTLENKMKTEHPILYDYISGIRKSLHPYKIKNPIGWSRIDKLNDNSWLIEEIQHDFLKFNTWDTLVRNYLGGNPNQPEEVIQAAENKRAEDAKFLETEILNGFTRKMVYLIKREALKQGIKNLYWTTYRQKLDVGHTNPPASMGYDRMPKELGFRVVDVPKELEKIKTKGSPKPDETRKPPEPPKDPEARKEWEKNMKRSSHRGTYDPRWSKLYQDSPPLDKIWWAPTEEVIDESLNKFKESIRNIFG